MITNTEAIGYVMDYRVNNESTKRYIQHLQNKILEIMPLFRELKTKNIDFKDVSIDLYTEFWNCVSCLKFRSHHDKIDHLLYFREDLKK